MGTHTTDLASETTQLYFRIDLFQNTIDGRSVATRMSRKRKTTMLSISKAVLVCLYLVLAQDKNRFLKKTLLFYYDHVLIHQSPLIGNLL